MRASLYVGGRGSCAPCAVGDRIAIRNCQIFYHSRCETRGMIILKKSIVCSKLEMPAQVGRSPVPTRQNPPSLRSHQSVMAAQ